MATARRRRAERQDQYESESYRALVKRLAINLRRLRTERGWTQQEAGGRCDMLMQQYQRIEAAQTNVTFATLARLGRGFEQDPSALLCLSTGSGEGQEPGPEPAATDSKVSGEGVPPAA